MDIANNGVKDIRDFPLVYFLAKNVCDDIGVPLNNIKVSYDGIDGSIIVPHESSFGGTQIAILQSAILSSCRSAGRSGIDSQASGALAACAGIVQIAYGMAGIAPFEGSPFMMLDQLPMAFMCAKNFVCPVCELTFINFPIRFVNEPLSHHFVKDNTAFINSGIITDGGRDCVALACLIDLNGKNVRDCFVKLLSNRNSVRLFRVCIDEVYGNDSANAEAFMVMAHAFADMNYGIMSDAKIGQQAKTASFTPPSFWIFGLIEKMLAPVRGVRDNIAGKWAPISSEIWDRIDERRKKMGLPHAPMEVMLRVQAEPFTDENDAKILQSKLEDARLWKIKKLL